MKYSVYVTQYVNSFSNSYNTSKIRLDFDLDSYNWFAPDCVENFENWR